MRHAAVTAAAAALVLACAGTRAATYPPAPVGLHDDAARETLRRFTRALDAGRFDEAHALLSARWQAAYTPGRLALDFTGAGASARESSERAFAAANAPLERSAERVLLRLGGGRAAVLVAEGNGWRVDALE